MTSEASRDLPVVCESPCSGTNGHPEEYRRRAAEDRAFTRVNLSAEAARTRFRELMAQALE